MSSGGSSSGARGQRRRWRLSGWHLRRRLRPRVLRRRSECRDRHHRRRRRRHVARRPQGHADGREGLRRRRRMRCSRLPSIVGARRGWRRRCRAWHGGTERWARRARVAGRAGRCLRRRERRLRRGRRRRRLQTGRSSSRPTRSRPRARRRRAAPLHSEGTSTAASPRKGCVILCSMHRRARTATSLANELLTAHVVCSPSCGTRYKRIRHFSMDC
jgi:hypothetical protein